MMGLIDGFAEDEQALADARSALDELRDQRDADAGRIDELQTRIAELEERERVVSLEDKREVPRLNEALGRSEEGIVELQAMLDSERNQTVELESAIADRESALAQKEEEIAAGGPGRGGCGQGVEHGVQ